MGPSKPAPPRAISSTESSTEPFDPFSLPYPRLEARVTALGGAPLHALRWFRRLHRQGEPDPARTPELGRALTARLQATARPAQVVLEAEIPAPDGTRKFRYRLTDGARIESVLIPDKARLTLCLSSQAGCAVGCAFCATAAMGPGRNLSTGEIVAQLLAAREAAAAEFRTDGAEDAGGIAAGTAANGFRAGTGRGITNLVLMGMGEPLHNWPAVRDAIRIFTDVNGHAFSRQRITVSTSGVLPRMADVIRETGVGLALSLHATDEETRTRLIPLNQRYPMTTLLAEAARLAREEKARIMIQYLLLEGLNDSPAHAQRLGELVSGFPCHVNLLTCNPVPGLPFRPPSADAVRLFKAALLRRGLRVYHRESRGAEVGAACGQLAAGRVPPEKEHPPPCLS